MLIPRTQFQAELRETGNPGRTPLVLIGMSGVGKSRWAALLAETYRYSLRVCDLLIASSPAIEDLLRDIDGTDSTEKMGRYFGRPWDDDFAEKEKHYLALERVCMQEPLTGNTIVDTTGSAIYHPKELAAMAGSALVLYLEPEPFLRRRMYEKFRENPKPVCWNGLYHEAKGESHQEALARCYEVLIETRTRAYRQFADITLPAGHFKKKENRDPTMFTDAVAERLPQA